MVLLFVMSVMRLVKGAAVKGSEQPCREKWQVLDEWGPRML